RQEARAAGGVPLGRQTPEERVRMRILTELSNPREIRLALKRAGVQNRIPKAPPIRGKKTPDLRVQRALLKSTADYARLFNARLNARGEIGAVKVQKREATASKPLTLPEPRPCPKCGRPFVGAPRDRYCGRRCQNAAAQQRHRKELSIRKAALEARKAAGDAAFREHRRFCSWCRPDAPCKKAIEAMARAWNRVGPPKRKRFGAAGV